MIWYVGKSKKTFRNGESVRLPLGALEWSANPDRCVYGVLQANQDAHPILLTEHDGKVRCVIQELTHIKRQIHSPCEVCIHREADYCSDICSKCYKTGYKPITEESHELQHT